MSRSKIVLTLLTLALTSFGWANPIVVSTSTNALALAQLLAGSGITVDSATLTGAATQQGSFTGGTGILPFDAGILLTNGSANTAPGPNNSPSATTSVGTSGDAQLTTLAGAPTFDANILTFTFHKTNTSDPDVVSFQYVFASEEYNEFVGSPFNDVFGFFLNGVNIALVPGTSTPVAINTVNCGSNSAFYQSNDPFNSTAGGCNGSHTSLNTQYDGITGGLGSLSLFATGTLLPGENTIKLAVADTSDTVLDSAVFLKAGSFVSQPPPDGVPEPSSFLLVGGVVGALGIYTRRLRRTC